MKISALIDSVIPAQAGIHWSAVRRNISFEVDPRLRGYDKFLKYIVVSFIILLSVCSKTAPLYPDNDAAKENGVLEAHYTDHGTGHTEFQINMPDGKISKGEASLVREGSITFGSIFSTVYGNTNAYRSV